MPLVYYNYLSDEVEIESNHIDERPKLVSIGGYDPWTYKAKHDRLHYICITLQISTPFVENRFEKPDQNVLLNIDINNETAKCWNITQKFLNDTVQIYCNIYLTKGQTINFWIANNYDEKINLWAGTYTKSQVRIFI